MIVGDAFQIRDRGTGRFLQWEIVNSNCHPYRWGYVWHEDPRSAGVWTGGHVDRFLAAPENWIRDHDGRDLEKVPGPACGCCGKIERGWSENRYVIITRRFELDGEVYWRCEKHVDRNPCCIPGCRSTFAHKPPKNGRRAEDYSWTIMCGKCWRQAPKWMRDRVTRILRVARRRGWTDKISRVHNMAWEACRRTIVRRRTVEPGEILPSCGPPPAGMLAELERIGL